MDAFYRFHDLNAFDGDKRSCRNRLEGHNKRRRKPPSDARFLPAFQGRRLLIAIGALPTDVCALVEVACVLFCIRLHRFFIYKHILGLYEQTAAGWVLCSQIGHLFYLT